MHAQELSTCIETTLNSTTRRLPDTCSNFTGELQDIKEFQTYVQDTLQKKIFSASATLVALHDLVTKSVNKQFFPKGRGQLMCLTEVQQKFAPLPLFGTLPRASTVSFVHSQASAQRVPGLGLDAGPTCH